MDCQTTQSNVLCTNGYYGFQPVLNGAVSGTAGTCPQGANGCLSNGAPGGSYAEWKGAPQVAWQRKRHREDAVSDATLGDGSAGAQAHLNGTAAKRPCPDLYHAKLQQAMGGTLCNGASAAVPTVPVENGMDSISIGTDSMMMMSDECSGMEVTSCSMQNGTEAVSVNGHSVATVGASRPPHTCCSVRTQLCTMSFQQSYNLSSSKDCPRCLAGEPAPYMSIQQTVENLSKLY